LIDQFRKISVRVQREKIFNRLYHFIAVLAPIAMNYLDRRQLLRNAKWAAGPIQVLICGICLTFATPLCCALFAQRVPISVNQLESDVQEQIHSHDPSLKTVYYNKGLWAEGWIPTRNLSISMFEDMWRLPPKFGLLRETFRKNIRKHANIHYEDFCQEKRFHELLPFCNLYRESRNRNDEGRSKLNERVRSLRMYCVNSKWWQLYQISVRYYARRSVKKSVHFRQNIAVSIQIFKDTMRNF